MKYFEVIEMHNGKRHMAASCIYHLPTIELLNKSHAKLFERKKEKKTSLRIFWRKEEEG